MPSVKEGRESTGLSRRKGAVEELFWTLEEGFGGARNW